MNSKDRVKEGLTAVLILYARARRPEPRIEDGNGENEASGPARAGGNKLAQAGASQRTKRSMG